MTNTKNTDKTSKLSCRYYIQDAIPDPTYGVMKMGCAMIHKHKPHKTT